MDLADKLRSRGKAVEDDYFAREERALIEAIREKRQNGELDNWHRDDESLSE
ncbi:hypothetical protein [Photobacterium rosenbergii]|uniref:Uncharacterized protein n=1 Tax=Photobacterium rosenbergii TaxID=294936 RepID=A0ABU3ZJE2_9GAMM|nr:hypothetical protein [Photobacterium rosenbergii]MDV5170226.1 hypothetical protein [Photobacterium rosenbergii]